LYLNPLPNTSAPPIEHSIHQVVKEISLLYTIPLNPFFAPTGHSQGHAVQEATYAYCGQIFAQHFCNRLGAAYAALKTVLDESNPSHAEVLNNIKVRFREETFTREGIEEVVKGYPELMRALYVHFANVHYPDTSEDGALMCVCLLTDGNLPLTSGNVGLPCRINAFMPHDLFQTMSSQSY
jgi:glutamate dehydrogenase